MKYRYAGLITVLLVSVLWLPAYAGELDWPTLRHDQGRTGFSDGSGNINLPIVKWQYYLGGSIREENTWFGDVEGDGAREVAIIIGGRVILKDFSDHTIWRTGLVNASEIVGLYDIDNNGVNELVVTSDGPPSRIMIFNATNGNLLWSFDGFDPKTSDYPRRQVMVVDLDGDGLLDILTKPNEAYMYTHAFSFKSGFSSNALDNQIWTYRHALYGNATPYLIGDVDSDGKNEVVFLEYTRIIVIDALTGVADLEIGNIFMSHPFGPIYLKNVDEDPQLEIITVSDKNSYDYQITVFDAVDQAVSWQIQWYPRADKSIVSSADSLYDLDGDGSLEIVVSVFNDIDDELTVNGSTAADYDGVYAPEQWSLLVFDAASGALKANLPNLYLEGVKDFDGDGVAEIIAKQSTSGLQTVETFADLQAYNLVDGSLVKKWQIANSSVAKITAEITSEFNHYQNSPMPDMATADLNDDKDDELIVFMDTDNNDEIDALKGFDVSGTVPEEISSMPIASDSFIGILKAGENYTGGDAAELAVFSYTGHLKVLNSAFEEIASLTTGNYKTNPVAVDLDNDGVVEILVRKSNGVLVVLDAAMANIAEKPLVEWSFKDWYAPYISAADLNKDGFYELPVFDINDRQNPILHMLNHDGSILWSREFTGYGALPEQIAFGDFNVEATTDFMFAIRDYRQQHGNEHRLITMDGRNGNEIWNRPTVNNSLAQDPIFVVDVDKDGVDDVINTDMTQIDYYDGLDGTLMYSVSQGYWPIKNIIADFDYDGSEELLLNSREMNKGLQLFELFVDDPAWTLPHSNSYEVLTYPGIFHAEDGLGFIKPSTYGSLEAFDRAGLSIWEGPIYLREGNILFSDPGDNLSIEGITVADINNDGFEDALVGTADGWLMAIQIDNHTRLWSLNLQTAVYEPIVADVDMDGELEVLVVSGDGYMYLIDNQNLAAPENVRDVKLNSNFEIVNPSIDIDETGFTFGLAAKWDEVLQANGYKYSVFDETDTQILPWADSRGETEAIVELPLTIGKTYRFAVQAYAHYGLASAVVFTDGVTIIEDSLPLILNAKASPEIFNPHKTETEITAEFRDMNLLRSYSVHISYKPTAEDVKYFSGTLSSSSFDLSLIWDGLDEYGDSVTDGSYLITIYLDDAHMNLVWSTIEVKVDTTKPDKPEITSPAYGDVIDESTVEIKGIAEAHSTVEIHVLDESDFDCTTQSDENGEFVCTISDMADGTFNIKAFAIDQAGNKSDPSDLLKIEIDTTQQIDGDATGEDGDQAIDGDAEEDSEVDDVPINCNSGGNASSVALLLLALFGLFARRRMAAIKLSPGKR